MGNPKGVTVSTTPTDPVGRDNGIFAATPGEVISDGSKNLPAPETMPGQTVTALADGGHLGKVRITYQSTLLKYRRNSRWVWIARRVDKEPAPSNEGPPEQKALAQPD